MLIANQVLSANKILTAINNGSIEDDNKSIVKLIESKTAKLSKIRKLSKSQKLAKSKKPSKSENLPNFSTKEAKPSF